MGLPGTVAPHHAGLYRPGVSFRLLADEAERTILVSLASHMGPGSCWFCQWHGTTRVASYGTT